MKIIRFAWVLSKRELQVRYKNSMLGVSWTLFQPLSMVALFSLIFTYIFPFESTLPKAIFIFSGMICWNLFQLGFHQGSSCLHHQKELILANKQPLLAYPISKWMISIADNLALFPILLLASLYFNVPIAPTWFLMPLAWLPLILFGFLSSILLSRITIRFNDILHLLPLLVSISLWVSPVFYSDYMIPNGWNFIIDWNPVSQSIVTMRGMLSGSWPNSQFYLILTILIPLACLSTRLLSSKHDSLKDFL
jgi:lipopolysaccharide transport system permease protein